MSRFMCPQCQAEYAVTRSDAPADREPTCEQCDHRFPDQSGEGWLHYRRIDLTREAQGAATAKGLANGASACGSVNRTSGGTVATPR